MATPSETLRAAAAELRMRAIGTTPGRWSLCWNAQIGGYAVAHQAMVSADGSAINTIADLFGNRQNARWVALVNPAVAEPLAALLEAFIPLAVQIKKHGRLAIGDLSGYDAALTFARLIVSSEEPQT